MRTSRFSPESGVRPLLALFLLATGCYTLPPSPNRETVSSRLTDRFGHKLTDTPCGQFTLPPGASIEDGLTEDEAVAISLWNNAAFQDLLVDLGITRADLITAGLLPNPEFVYFFNVPDKPYKYAFEVAIESIWLRPIRVNAAVHDANRAAERLAQSGLDLMRDVRQAYADVVLAKERVRVAQEGVRLRGKIAEFAEKRLAEGDISPLEAATAKIDSLQAQQDATRIGFDVAIFEERLRNLLGLGPLRGPLPLDPAKPPPKLAFDVDVLTEEAMKNRPDALSATEAILAAEARVHFAKIGWVRLLGIGDATSGRNTGHEFSPALRFTLPIFNQNQGGISRAKFELERAYRQQLTIHNLIVLDVQRSYAQYQQAASELEILRNKVRPEVNAAISRAQLAYQEGNVNYLIVLETTRQLLDSFLREAVLEGDVRRFWAELERSVGRRLLPEEAKTAPELAVPKMMPGFAEERE